MQKHSFPFGESRDYGTDQALLLFVGAHSFNEGPVVLPRRRDLRL